MRSWIGAALAAAIAFSVYLPTLRHGFVWDDHILIEANPLFAHPNPVAELAASSLGRRPSNRIEGAARPLFVLSLALDRALWGEEPAGFHLTNAALHATNAALIVLLASAMFSGGVPALAGALFAVHPINSEAVNAIGFRADVLAATFLLLGCYSFLRLARARERSARAGWLALSVASYGLGLLSKEMAVTLPALAFLSAWAAGAGGMLSSRWKVGAAAAYVLVLCGYWGFRHPRSGYRVEAVERPPVQDTLRDAVASSSAPAGRPGAFHPSPPPWSRVYRDRRSNALTMSGILGEYLRLLVFPYPLVADRAPRLISSPLDPRAWSAWLLAAGLLLLALRARVARPEIAFGIAWTFVALVPVSNVFPLYNPFAERYLYSVSVGACLALAGAIEAFGPGRARLALGGLLLLPYAGWTVRRSRVWRSDEALFEAPRRVENARVHYNLGVLRQRDGALADAEREYRRAVELHPGYVEALTNLALLLQSSQRLPEARALYERAVALGPQSPVPYDALGTLRLQEGRAEDGLRLFQWALRIDPSYASARLHEGEAYARLGRWEQATGSYAEAQRLDPARPEAPYNLGMLYDRLRRYDEAEQALVRALVLDPRHRDAAMNLGVVFHHKGEFIKAQRWLRRALDLDPDFAPAHYNLAMVESDVENFGEAVRHLDDAVRLDPRYADAWYALGVVRQRIGGPVGAMQAYRKALELEPGRVEAWTNLAGLLELSGDLKGAGRALDRAMALDPGRPAVLNNLGNLLLRQGKVREAASRYQEALRQAERWGDSPESRAPTRVNLGLCLQRLGELPAAIGQWRQAVSEAPRYRQAYVALGRALANAGRWEEADAVWHQLLRVYPDDPDGLRGLSR